MSYIVEKFKKKYAGDHIIFRNHPVLHKIAVCLIYSFIFGLVFASAYKLLYPATGFLTLGLILLAYTFGSTIIAFFWYDFVLLVLLLLICEIAKDI